MARTVFPLLSLKEQESLIDALHYLKMPELKRACHLFQLPLGGKKGALIDCISRFIASGRITKAPEFPRKSLAEYHPKQPLKKESLMLFGGFKNNEITRNFFKKLIGPQFHFTAFGVDWLAKRWHAGNPPTYQEYADFWQAETARRKSKKATPKKEWRFIGFLQEMHEKNPELSKQQLQKEWKKIQQQKAKDAGMLLKKAAAKLKH